MTFLFFLTKPVFFCRLQVNFFYSCPDFRNHISSQFYLPEILSPDPSLVTKKSDRICLGTDRGTVQFRSRVQYSLLLGSRFCQDIFLFSPFLHCYLKELLQIWISSAKQFGSIDKQGMRLNTISGNTENKPQVAWLRFQRDIPHLCISPAFRQPNAIGHFRVSPLNSLT